MTTRFEQSLTAWYAASARDLPWRRPGVGAWPVLVSEFMLQQTPVSRVLPAYEAWLARWPTAASLATATPGDAVRQWGRLGYPRRALRLHACAEVITARHAGQVPASISDLRALPGVGSYTAAAVASFAFGQRHAVLDTNVRRVLARLVTGQDLSSRSSASVAETRLAESLLPPAEARRAATWSVAVMELGALICTAARPACGSCPLAGDCAWRLNGSPAAQARRPAQRYEGTDRQCRGAVLAVLRNAAGPVPAASLDACWPEAGQLARVLDALVKDGLATLHDGGLIGLPGDLPAAPLQT
ncbi:MAG TPA: A/G-specific adenine glycosylase [Streptosporangiaceae bacterium]|jgi:A/G-specific adenine glycosylase|nr:A/G-specific adenine glycosylase [Streptosporangiaceae bacterium]